MNGDDVVLVTRSRKYKKYAKMFGLIINHSETNIMEIRRNVTEKNEYTILKAMEMECTSEKLNQCEY